MINKLFFSTVDHDWTGHNSQLLNYKNLKHAIHGPVTTDYHTSIEDLCTENFPTACEAAKEIVVVGISIYNMCKVDKIDATKNYSLSRFLYVLNKFSNKVIGLNECLADVNIQTFNKLQSVRHTDSKVLWTVGCSVTFGTGVNEHQRYGHLLSKFLNLPEITLSANGSSIHWAADQILRSDIRHKDIVVWGITTPQRVDWANEWILKSNSVVNINWTDDFFRSWSFEYFDSTTHLALCFQKILQVVNFCKKVGADLYLANILDTGLTSIFFKDFDNFIDLIDNVGVDGIPLFADHGTDNLHPGPEQHKIYAERIFDLIRKLDKGVC